MKDDTITNASNTTHTEILSDATNNKEIADPPVESNVEMAKLKLEMTKLKAANDKLVKENAEKTKQIRAKQSAEEAAAEEAREKQEAQANELAELRKKFAIVETSKKILSFVTDESAANEVSEYLYGAEDIYAAIDIINKAWAAKEKALRLEYGKIPAPSAGMSDLPSFTKEQLNNLSYKERVKFANEHPAEYNKIMGR